MQLELYRRHSLNYWTSRPFTGTLPRCMRLLKHTTSRFCDIYFTSSKWNQENFKKESGCSSAHNFVHASKYFLQCFSNWQFTDTIQTSSFSGLILRKLYRLRALTYFIRLKVKQKCFSQSLYFRNFAMQYRLGFISFQYLSCISMLMEHW